ncbi:E3 SUMO-protein ligase ZNF451 isoform X1 [Conger conger]|uniref:E3 SUMO-protein ligase ZNF451 isoform X1 n=1 Tax=Conger conger TaxID=82655 RepID=UPI002A5AF68D|nr:E3 SUMO-protein ligase ZNF451 isoform X1 [Conger conger]XP_061084184.1 E3 SUMO-protein ligase ZNF451 isoform X1 [Conger conger]XP_061084185.1 E3 SUMO-protein ligase ZNF451 isoform X1 [Conger conger]XP_061084186.1 E3 SUMO-protein ligase ZNF451 isoform X1 [Conger conger]
MMATTPAKEEDEVEFVSEGPQRPVLEYIDLLSDGENEDSELHGTLEDQVNRQKAKVASTLDRLAHKVAVEKQEREEKCRAFKAKMISQQAHGRQELAFHAGSGESRDAKNIVNMWLKMPGAKPGSVHTGFRSRRSAPFPSDRPQPSSHTCPVINCGRVFEGVLLLEGHLKRFDHSPCDPTIKLKGAPNELYACVACRKHFQTKGAWQDHLKSKVSSPSPEGHVSSQSFQVIQCFACPGCCLLFNLMDQCLQHMAAYNHFNQSVSLSETPQTAVPIPVPCYAKNRLIALCKEVPFCVRCTSCRSPLNSHMAARAHFSVQCRQGGAVAEAAQSLPEVMGQVCAYGRCAQCQKTFLGQEDAADHARQTQHKITAFETVQEALLHYSQHHDTLRAAKRAGPRDRGHEAGSPAKRRRGPDRATAWVCECGLSFPEEPLAHSHLLASNQVFHKCGVCEKEMGEGSITRLHMSRFHGGAHLSNFLFRCRRCRVDMPREEDILSHVREAHAGHTFYREQEAAEEEPASVSRPPAPAKPPLPSAPAPSESEPGPAARPSGSGRRRRWLCRMCEDVFGSEASVRAHCGDVSAHSFHKFLCSHCDQRFFKEATLERHCRAEHEGSVELRRFCGLCDSMPLDGEEDFLRHYRSLHAVDYCRLEEEEEGPRADTPSAQTPAQSAELRCLCMGGEKGKAEQRDAFTACMKRLASQGKCTYVCPLCDLQTHYYIQAKEHVRLKHGSQGKPFLVMCGFCPGSYPDVPGFHNHYHAQHCSMEPCVNQRGGGGPAGKITPKVTSKDGLKITPKVTSKDGLKITPKVTSKDTLKDTPRVTQNDTPRVTPNDTPQDTPKVLKAEEVFLETDAEEFGEVKRALALSSAETRREAEGDSEESDEDLKRALALSTQEAEQQAEMERALYQSLNLVELDLESSNSEMKEALERSLLEF